MGTTPVNPTAALSFTGISTFSNDFQAILQRQDAIAQLPITALQNRESDNVGKKTALVGLNPVVSSLASAVAALGSVASGQGLTASSSDSSTVSIVNTGATAPNKYTISNITVATAASELSLAKYTDATTAPVWVAGQNKFDLVAGSTTYHLDLTGKDNLAGLENAINSSGAPVNASIINSGSGDYLSLSANNVGATTLTLKGIPQSASLLTNLGTGTETSLAGYPDTGATAVSNSGIVNLTVGGGAVIPLNITATNNLTGLMNAINGAGAGVTASIATSGGINHLQLVAAGGPTAITLTDTPGASPVSLITGTNQGGNADFMLDSTIHVNQASNVFTNVIAGVSFSLNKSNAGSVTLNLASDTSQLTNSLQNFTQAYNALAAQVAQQSGPGAGALGGDTLIRNISDDLRQLSGYFASSNTSIRSLSDLGITFDTTGQLSFNSSVVNGFTNTQTADAFKFLGSSNSGFAHFASNFTQLSDPISGLIQIQETGYDTTDTQISSQVSVLTTRAALAHAANTKKLQAADALVAQLQSNQNTVNAEIQSVNYVAFGKIVNSSGQ